MVHLLQRHRFLLLTTLFATLICWTQAKKWSDLQETKDGDAKYVGSWSSWSTWSECSRSCGGGVSVQTRECKTQRLHHKKHLRYRQFSSNKARSRCVGVYRRHQLCNPKPCPGKFPDDFRKEQCSAFNQNKLYKWEPFYESSAPCALNCRAIGYRFYATLAQHVVDGTPCDHQGSSKRICVGGICKPIGCEGLIGSNKVFDHCGVCGGDNSTCRIVSGLFTRPQLTTGYNIITTIPQGACNINITELKPTKNYLALKQSAGEYIINGNWALNWPGDYPAAGTVFTYHRDDAVSSSIESIIAPGPTNQPLELMMIYKQLNPGIKYQYTLPLRIASSTRTDVGMPLNDIMGVMTPLSDTPTQYSIQSAISPKPPRGGRVGRTKSRRHYKWEIRGFTECSKTCAGGTQSTILVCIKESSKIKVADVYCKNIAKTQIRIIPCNSKPCPPSWVPGEWSPCSVTCGQGIQHRTFTCKQQMSSSTLVPSPPESCPQEQSEPSSQSCQIISCTTWRVGRWSQCSTTCGKGVRNRQVHCVSRDETSLADSECSPEDKPSSQEICDLGSCSKDWFFTEWSSHQCIDSCSRGIQSRKVFCPSVEACDIGSRPTDTKPCPINEDATCSAKWFTGPWSPCSVSCGKGIQTRDIICVMHLRGQNRAVQELHCQTIEKPSRQQLCQKQECGSEWYFTQWTECSKPCDGGIQSREVRCLSESQKSSLTCLPEEKPVSQHHCNTQVCHLDTSQKDSGCTDKFRNCHLVAQSRLCSYNYYRDACCQSCARFT